MPWLDEQRDRLGGRERGSPQRGGGRILEIIEEPLKQSPACFESTSTKDPAAHQRRQCTRYPV